MAQLIISTDTCSLCEASMGTDSRLTLTISGQCFGAMPTLYDNNDHFSTAKPCSSVDALQWPRRTARWDMTPRGNTGDSGDHKLQIQKLPEDGGSRSQRVKEHNLNPLHCIDKNG